MTDSRSIVLTSSSEKYYPYVMYMWYNVICEWIGLEGCGGMGSYVYVCRLFL